MLQDPFAVHNKELDFATNALSDIYNQRSNRYNKLQLHS